MIAQHFYISSCEWGVYAFYDVTHHDVDDVYKTLTRIGCQGKQLRSAIRNISAGIKNSGFTFTNVDESVSVVVIGQTTSADEFASTFDHEKGHLVRHISQSLGVAPYSEEEQYIAGDVGKEMFRIGKHFMCDHCRADKDKFFKTFRL